MAIFRKYITMITIFVIAMFIIGCSGGTIPTNPGDGDGDGNGNGDEPEPNDPPSALYSSTPELRTYLQHQQVSFDGSVSTDPDNNISGYEWDFHYDDQNFTIEATGPNLNYALPSFGSVVAALRVVDAGEPSLSSIYRTRLNVQPVGELVNITNGEVDDFLLRRAIESQGDFYVLYTGIVDAEEAAWIQRSSDAGKTWGEPVEVSTLDEDKGPWGIWMAPAPFGICLAWISTTGRIKYTYGEPDGVNSVTFADPVELANVGTAWYEPVVYSIAASPDGNYAYIVFMTTDSASLEMISANLNQGAVTDSKRILIANDTADRFNLSGASAATGPTGRVYVTHIWKSLGYDNDDMVRLYYLDPPADFMEGPIRADVGLDGFIFDHDPHVIVNSDNEPIVVLRTTGLYQGGKDVALCISDGDPPVFRQALRANNTLNGDALAIQNSPTIAYDSDHGHLWVAFEDFRDKDKISQVYLTLFDNQFSTLLPDFDISDDPALIYSDINPHVSIRGGANPALVVVWERDGTDIVACNSSY
jgi:hypothetical protein